MRSAAAARRCHVAATQSAGMGTWARGRSGEVRGGQGLGDQRRSAEIRGDGAKLGGDRHLEQPHEAHEEGPRGVWHVVGQEPGERRGQRLTREIHRDRGTSVESAGRSVEIRGDRWSAGRSLEGRRGGHEIIGDHAEIMELVGDRTCQERKP